MGVGTQQQDVAEQGARAPFEQSATSAPSTWLLTQDPA